MYLVFSLCFFSSLVFFSFLLLALFCLVSFVFELFEKKSPATRYLVDSDILNFGTEFFKHKHSLTNWPSLMVRIKSSNTLFTR